MASGGSTQDLSDTRTRISTLEVSHTGLRAELRALHATVREQAANQRLFNERLFKELRGVREDLRFDLTQIRESHDKRGTSDTTQDLKLQEQSMEIKALRSTLEERAASRMRWRDMMLGAAGSLLLLLLGWVLTWAPKPW